VVEFDDIEPGSRKFMWVKLTVVEGSCGSADPCFGWLLGEPPFVKAGVWAEM
jgi:hypothetical protein